MSTPEARRLHVTTFAEACDRVRDCSADAAVLPLENSTAGTVDDVYALLLKDQLYLWRSLSLPIRHHLLACPGSSIDAIRTVLSHPQALAQCSDFISSRGWAVREALNTAFAAGQVATSGDKSLAAIASLEAAQTSGLDVLRSDINNTHSNQTRFIVVGRDFLVT
ncbi:prephenate dehydratase domain-containing protein, partial [Guyparkeria sp.]|uniref:prephenate dehydratase domain-containing protein n=1 Tax=Guyparkeria sp. TaxID=2035736 RepID=UPI0039705A35